MSNIRLNPQQQHQQLYAGYSHHRNPRRTLSSTASSSKAQAVHAAGTARTMRLLIVALAMVALFIMLLNLSFVYSRVSHQTSAASAAANNAHNSNNPRHAQFHPKRQPPSRSTPAHPDAQSHGGEDYDILSQKQHHITHKHQKSWKLGGALSPGSLLSLTTNRGQQKRQRPSESNSLGASAYCQSIDSIDDMLRCYRPDLGKRLLQGMEQLLPKHCYHQSIQSSKNGGGSTTINTSVQNWTMLQSCLSFVRSTPGTIRNIHILGERHSGTKFVMQELQRCFPRNTNMSLKVHRDFARSKHFFQPLFDNNTDGESDSQPPDYSSSLIVAIFRDPLDWVEAMRQKPYHAPFHMDRFVGNAHQNEIRPLDWQDFVSRPWTMPNSESYDLVAPARTMAHNNSNVLRSTLTTNCRYGFESSDVVPCLYNPDSKLVPPNRVRGFEPLYELQRNVMSTTQTLLNNRTERTTNKNPPFENILQLRAEKIWHMAVELPLLTPNLGGFLPIRYEDVLQHGMQPIVDWLSQHLGNAAPMCSGPPTGPQPHLLENRRRKTMPPDYVQWIQSHAHIPTEKLLGYYPFEDDATGDGNDIMPKVKGNKNAIRPWMRKRMALAAEPVAVVE